MEETKGGGERQRFESLLHHHLQRRAALAPPLSAGDHLDEDALAAFTEGRLSKTESTPVVSHLIDCSFCRHTTAHLFRLAAELGEFEHESEALRQPQPQESGRVRQLLESLAARVLPASDESAVFAYQVRAEETEELNDSGQEGNAEESKAEARPASEETKEVK
ncbi:MAG: hypothetical protein WKF30_14735 [Pyrinomonadaceae bacterium]